VRGAAYEVVGVIGDYRNTALQNRELDPKLYLPLGGAEPAKRMHFLIRATSEPGLVVRGLRREIARAAPGNLVTGAFTLTDIIAVAGQEILVGTAPLVPLIATGMLLTAAGVYGVLAFAVRRRSKELALRMAIGASAVDVLRLVTRQSVRVLAIGIASGVGATFVLARVARTVGGAGGMFDPNWPAFVVPTVIIVVTGALATWVPSRRALEIDPATLLRID